MPISYETVIPKLSNFLWRSAPQQSYKNTRLPCTQWINSNSQKNPVRFIWENTIPARIQSQGITETGSCSGWHLSLDQKFPRLIGTSRSRTPAHAWRTGCSPHSISGPGITPRGQRWSRMGRTPILFRTTRVSRTVGSLLGHCSKNLFRSTTSRIDGSKPYWLLHSTNSLGLWRSLGSPRQRF